LAELFANMKNLEGLAADARLELAERGAHLHVDTEVLGHA
jgi:hypothetical protein